MKTSFVKYVVSPSSELSMRTLEIMIGAKLARVGVTYGTAICETNDGPGPTDADTSNDSESRLGTAHEVSRIITSDS